MLQEKVYYRNQTPTVEPVLHIMPIKIEFKIKLQDMLKAGLEQLRMIDLIHFYNSDFH